MFRICPLWPRRIRMTTTAVYILMICGVSYIMITTLLYRKTNLLQLMTSQVAPDTNRQVCVVPKLDPWDKTMMRHMVHVPTPECGKERDWIMVNNGSAKLTEKALKEHGDISCKISYIQRKNDYEITWSDEHVLKGHHQIKLQDDFFWAKCVSSADGVSHDNFYAGVSYKADLHEPSLKSPSTLNLNVLVIGLDSVSHMTFIRKMRRSLEYFTSNLDALILNGYNIVGDGTPQAFIPILTGKTEQELPIVLQRATKKDFVDIYPMIWKDFKQEGYVTTFIEDYPRSGMFTYRFTGFKEQPTDHYMRPFYLATDIYDITRLGLTLNILSKDYQLCLGGKRKSEIVMNYVRDLYAMYPTKPKFTISFLGDMSHDDRNTVETADGRFI